ncbi:MAG: hypothetical protein ACXAEU_01245 [Candidatus Hodarchaeales archaeon]|jgi:hypothetical protein
MSDFLNSQAGSLMQEFCWYLFQLDEFYMTDHYYVEITCSEFTQVDIGTRVQITGYFILSQDEEPYISDTREKVKLALKQEKHPDLDHNQLARVFGQVGEEVLDVDHITHVQIDLSRYLHLKDLEEK